MPPIIFQWAWRLRFSVLRNGLILARIWNSAKGSASFFARQSFLYCFIPSVLVKRRTPSMVFLVNTWLYFIDATYSFWLWICSHSTLSPNRSASVFKYILTYEIQQTRGRSWRIWESLKIFPPHLTWLAHFLFPQRSLLEIFPLHRLIENTHKFALQTKSSV